MLCEVQQQPPQPAGLKNPASPNGPTRSSSCYSKCSQSAVKVQSKCSQSAFKVQSKRQQLRPQIRRFGAGVEPNGGEGIGETVVINLGQQIIVE